MLNSVRFFSTLGVLCALLLAAQPASAQTYTWQNFNGTTSNPGYWTDSTWDNVPTFAGTDTVLNFGKLGKLYWRRATR